MLPLCLLLQGMKKKDVLKNTFLEKRLYSTIVRGTVNWHKYFENNFNIKFSILMLVYFFDSHNEARQGQRCRHRAEPHTTNILQPSVVWGILHGEIYSSEVRIWISEWPSVSGFVLFNKRLSYKFKYDN